MTIQDLEWKMQSLQRPCESFDSSTSLRDIEGSSEGPVDPSSSPEDPTHLAISVPDVAIDLWEVAQQSQLIQELLDGTHQTCDQLRCWAGFTHHFASQKHHITRFWEEVPVANNFHKGSRQVWRIPSKNNGLASRTNEEKRTVGRLWSKWCTQHQPVEAAPASQVGWRSYGSLWRLQTRKTSPCVTVPLTVSTVSNQFQFNYRLVRESSQKLWVTLSHPPLQHPCKALHTLCTTKGSHGKATSGSDSFWDVQGNSLCFCNI